MSLKAVRRAVVAIGGNALLKPGDTGAASELHARASEVAGGLVALIRQGVQVLIVHGNGPQVGVEFLRGEEASTKVPPFPLDLCVASTQGSIAALLELALRNALHEENLEVPVAGLLSLVEVDATDPGFGRPTKPIGLFYSAYRAQQLRADFQARGWDVVEDSGRGFRPVVPSPLPIAMANAPAAKLLLASGAIVIAGGGGGVPVVRGPDGRLRGVEAVIDKDRTAVLIATAVEADTLIFLTGVPWVELNHRTPFARRLDRVTATEVERHLSHGQFPAGSMGPKIEAAISFVRARPNSLTLITSAESLAEATAGRSGTRIVSDPDPATVHPDRTDEDLDD